MIRVLAALVAGFLCLPAFAATCKISEYANMVIHANGRIVPVAQEPSLTTQSVTYDASMASAAFNAATGFVRIVCDAKAHFIFTSAGTNATADHPYLSANTAEYFGIQRVAPGQSQALTVEFYDGST
jgi:hypothetical protein